MKGRLYFIISFLLIVSPNVTVGEITGTNYSIIPDTGYEYKTQAEGEIIWQEAKSQIISMNFTLVSVPSNISNIYIEHVSFDYIGNINGREQQFEISAVNPDIILSSTNTSIVINKTLFPPDTVDNFYLNISMLVGTSKDRELRSHAIRFPDSGTIFVDRDRVSPLVNLYGFPSRSFFVKWLPFYLGTVFLLSIPGTYYYSTKLISSSKTKIVEPEVTGEIEVEEN